MLRYFGALDAAPVFPVAPALAPAVDTGAALLELDELIGAYDAALAARDDAARQVAVLEQRIALVRLTLAGQVRFEGGGA